MEGETPHTVNFAFFHCRGSAPLSCLYLSSVGHSAGSPVTRSENLGYFWKFGHCEGSGRFKRGLPRRLRLLAVTSQKAEGPRRGGCFSPSILPWVWGGALCFEPVSGTINANLLFRRCSIFKNSDKAHGPAGQIPMPLSS
jgi:hypothetical protein